MYRSSDAATRQGQTALNQLLMLGHASHDARLSDLEQRLEAFLREGPFGWVTRVDFTDEPARLSGFLEDARALATTSAEAVELRDRLRAVINLKGALSKAIEAARSPELRLQRLALVAVLNALENTYAEDLTQEQLNAVENALRSVSLAAFDRAQAASISRELKAAGLSAVPALSPEQRQRLLDSLE